MTTENATAISGREIFWRLALALVPGLVLVLLRGVDTNWDLRNYHLYNPHAWWTGRMLLDIAPAQLQTWHNPLLDLPLYLLATSGLDMRWTSLWLTLPFATAIYLLLRLQDLLSPTAPSRTSQVVLALLALSGAATWSTIGNSMNDGFVAAALLGSLWLVLKPDTSTARHWLLAGLLAGAMMGLKLTASAYCLALAVTAIAASGTAQLRVQRVLGLGIGGLLGFLASYGWWGWKLWGLFGNPFFPYYNNLFKSPALALADYADDRFRAHGVTGVFELPFQLLQKSVSHSELYLRDPRLLIALAGSLVLVFWLHRHAAQERLQARVRMVAVFVWSGFVLWALQYGIYRYVALLELLGVLALVLALQRLPQARGLTMVAALVLVSVATSRPDWGHSRHTVPRFGIAAMPVESNAMVLVAGNEPVAYAVLGLPPDVPMVALANSIQIPETCTGLQQRARQALAAHPGPLWLLAQDAAAMSRSESLVKYNYKLERAGSCWEYPSALGTARLCPQRRTAPTPVCEVSP